MKISGTSSEKASQAKMTEPKDWPKSVKCGHVEERTQSLLERYRKVMVGGCRWMLNLLFLVVSIKVHGERSFTDLDP